MDISKDIEVNESIKNDRTQSITFSMNTDNQNDNVYGYTKKEKNRKFHLFGSRLKINIKIIFDIVICIILFVCLILAITILIINLKSKNKHPTDSTPTTSTTTTSTISDVFKNNSMPLTLATLNTTIFTTNIPNSSQTINPNIYIPCQKYFVLFIDISNGLTSDQFNQEINFITNIIIKNWTHIENVGVGFYWDHVLALNFAELLTMYDLNKTIRENGQINTTPNLDIALVAADKIYQNNPYSISYILFTSTTNEILRSGTVAAAQSLASKGKFTVVTMGTADFTLVNNISNNIIPWPDMSQPPVNWQSLIYDALDCNLTAPTPPSQPTTQAQVYTARSTTPNSTTQFPISHVTTNPTTVAPSSTSTLTPTGTTIASDLYCLCSGCSRYVIILIDVSNAMSPDQFNNQKTFLINYLLGTGNFNHFERVAVIFYADVVIGNASFGSFQSHDDLFNYINNINQSAVTTSKIAPALSLAASSSVLINTTSTVTILFTSTADPTDVSTATTSANTLRAAGRFSAVTIGDANFGPINNNFADYIIPWASGSTPPNGNGNDWENYFKIALMCSVLPATTPIVTTQFVTTTMISAPTTTTNPAIYIPCQKFFVLLIDISIGLTATQYAQEIDYITTNLVADNWTHIENVGVEFYSDQADIRNFNASKTVDVLRQIIRENNQNTATPTLYRALVAADEIYQNNPYSISYILFTSTTNEILRSGTVAAAQSLASKGKFTVVTMGTADFTLVNNISNNIIPWPDMSQPPVNWQSLIYDALDCNGSSTIAPPTSTATSSSTSNGQTTASITQPIVTQPTTQPVATTQPATGPSSSNICNTYIALAVDDSASITDTVFNLQVNYINDTTNGFFSLYNRSIPAFSWYAEGGATSFDSYNGGFSLLQTYINTVLKRTTSSINWSKITVYSGLTQMANDADDANIYPLQIPLNTIIFINSAPPPTDEVKSLIQRLATPTFQYQPRSVIGVLLNNVNIDPGLSGSGLKTVIWTDDHASLTSQLRHIDMTCA